MTEAEHAHGSTQGSAAAAAWRDRRTTAPITPTTIMHAHAAAPCAIPSAA